MDYKSNQIEAIMLSLRDERQVANLSRFFKTGPGQYGEGDMFLGIKVPVTRGVVKSEWRDCTLVDVDCLLHSCYHEIRLCALLILVEMFKHSKKDAAAQKRIVEFYLANTERINNWDLVDLSCYEIVGAWLLRDGEGLLRLPDSALSDSKPGNGSALPGCRMLSEKPGNGSTLPGCRMLSEKPGNGSTLPGCCMLSEKPGNGSTLPGCCMLSGRQVLYELARNGRTMWEQRIAIVSCMAFVRKGQLDDCFAIADILLHHQHDLIHKAVGWLLRETDKRDPQALREFLAPRYKEMPRTMLRYAIEKFPEEERQAYLKGEV